MEKRENTGAWIDIRAVDVNAIPSENDNPFWKSLKTACRRAGVQLADLATNAGTNYSTLYRQNYAGTLSEASRVRIRELLLERGVDINELIVEAGGEAIPERRGYKGNRLAAQRLIPAELRFNNCSEFEESTERVAEQGELENQKKLDCNPLSNNERAIVRFALNAYLERAIQRFQDAEREGDPILIEKTDEIVKTANSAFTKLSGLLED